MTAFYDSLLNMRIHLNPDFSVMLTSKIFVALAEITTTL